jgi:hypothetical protein
MVAREFFAFQNQHAMAVPGENGGGGGTGGTGPDHDGVE